MKRHAPDSLEKHRKTRDDDDDDDQKFKDITNNGRKIMPENFRKYGGSVSWNKRINRWTVLFQRKEYKEQKSFKSFAEAVDHVKKVGARENLVKNICYGYNGQYYCTLTRKKIMKFSIQDLNLVDEHIWYATFNNRKPRASVYAATNIAGVDRTTVKFHQFILPRTENETVDHINIDSLDNRRENLRYASKSTQSINIRLKSNNSSGMTGVEYIKCHRSWCAKWTDENGKTQAKNFSVSKYGDMEAKLKATAHRMKMVNTISRYTIALKHNL
jgi:hypothetical protein